MVRAWRKRISMVSHNIQKFAKKKTEKCKRKEVVIRSILKEEIPDLYLLQEVTSQNFFKEEMQCLRSSDYYVAMGPSFSSGSYLESYPLIFNLATIHYAPLPYRMNGRMGKNLAIILRGMGAEVFCAARKKADLMQMRFKVGGNRVPAVV